MADMNRLREPTELAAASPDPAIRRIAARRLELAKEIAQIDSLMQYLYGNLPARIEMNIEPDHFTKHSFKVASGEPTRANASTRNRSKALIDALKKVLISKGPLDLDNLTAAYNEAFPSEQRSRQTIRVALSSRKDIIGRLDDKRFWPVGPDVGPLNTGSLNGVTDIA